MADDFAGQLDWELLAYFTGSDGASPTRVHARPTEGPTVAPFSLLATGEGASIAARAGLPTVIGQTLRGRERMLRGIDRYRAEFRPSAWAAEPAYVMISGTVAVAGSEPEARRLLVPEAWSMAHSRTHGIVPAAAADRARRGRWT